MSTSRSKHPEGRSRQARQDQPESSTSRHSAELIAQQTTIEAHQGPLPTPDDLAQYDKVLPGLADRIVVMAEKEQAHRIDSEQKILRASIVSHHRGQLLATFLGLIGFVVAIAFGYWGFATAGAGLAGGVILSIVGVLYVKQRYAKQVPLSGKTAEK